MLTNCMAYNSIDKLIVLIYYLFNFLIQMLRRSSRDKLMNDELATVDLWE